MEKTSGDTAPSPQTWFTESETSAYRKALSVAEEVGILRKIDKLRRRIKEENPDVTIRIHDVPGQKKKTVYRNLGSGRIALSLEWNYQKDKEGIVKGFDAVVVYIDAFTEGIIVEGKESRLIRKTRWSSLRQDETVNGALEFAYENPRHVSWPPSPLIKYAYQGI